MIKLNQKIKIFWAVIVGFGSKPPEGHLPVFSVGSEKEAKFLFTLSCGTNIKGEYIARELVEEQTIDNLFAFGERLEMMHDKFIKGTKHCNCKEES